MLDSVGFSASLANRVMLGAARPSAEQIKFRDRFLVPTSRAIDPLTGFMFGKSVLAVWPART
jgi:hypothetical protein